MVSFSIIIPTYNYGHLISFALDSVICQLENAPNLMLEVIIIDDCSTDNTLQVLEQYSTFPFIKILANHENLGPAKSRNKAISNSAGQYILFLDADDMLTPNSLQTIMDFVQSHNLPDMVIADHNSVVRANDGKIVIKKIIKNDKLSSSKQQRFIDYLFKKSISLSAGSMIFKKEILNTFKFCEETKLNEDIPLFAHAIVNYDCQYLPFSTVSILKHNNSLRNNHKLLNEEINVNHLTEIIFDERYIPREVLHLKNSYLSLRYLSLFRSYYLAEQYKQARKIYWRAIRVRWQNIFKMNYLVKYLRSFC